MVDCSKVLKYNTLLNLIADFTENHLEAGGDRGQRGSDRDPVQGEQL